MVFSIIYVAAIVAANITVASFGPWFSPINALLLIGMDLSIRDHLHDRWDGRWLWVRMLIMIGCAGVLSYALNPDSGRIALASMISFCIAAVVDAVTYSVFSGKVFFVRSNYSNIAGAAVDSIFFPLIAFSSLMPIISFGQFIAKVLGGVFFCALIYKFNESKYLRID